jgi:micrococcal nuclease
MMYEYAATVLKVVDGDTVHAELDLGIDVRIRLVLRLVGINAPELRTAAGPPARQHLIDLIPSGGAVVVRTVKDHTEKFGRYLAVLLADGVNLNQKMIEDGFAVAYNP